jgi:putative DNA primase/helicase
MTPRGFHDATADPTIICRWFAKRDYVNLGAVTGSSAGYFVLDIDPDKGGADSLADLERAHGALPTTPTILTGGGGAHLLFACPADRTICGRVGVRPGLDVRGDGGYHILPPSLHVSGRHYEWDAGAHPEDVPLAAAPGWLLELVTQAGSEPHGSLDLAVVLAGVPDGQRHVQLFRAACKLRGAGVDYVYAREVIVLAAGRCTPPLPEREAVRALDSAFARYQPRTAASGLAAPRRPLRPSRFHAEVGG